MSYSGADDQSEDGEIKRSPYSGRKEELDFSLSDEGDTADLLDIKPPQASLIPRSSGGSHKRSDRNREGRSRHSRSEKHRDLERAQSHRDSEKRHRNEKHDMSRGMRDYREREMHREKDAYGLRDHYGKGDYRETREVRYSESTYKDSHGRTVSRERREEIKTVADTSRDIRYLESRVRYENEKRKQEYHEKYLEHEAQSESRRNRNQKYYENTMEMQRERKEIKYLEDAIIESRRDKKDLRYLEEGETSDERTAADRALEDLRERLLDKRRSKEMEDHRRKDGKTSRKHKTNKDQLEAGEIIEDSKTYVREIIDLSKEEIMRREGTSRQSKRGEKDIEMDEISAKDKEERNLRKEKLLEAEREMARQKEQYKLELEVRRKRRERKRQIEEQNAEANKKKKMQEDEAAESEEVKNPRASALTDEITGVVTVSDNSGSESEMEVETIDVHSEHRNRAESDVTEDSEESSSHGSRGDSEHESIRSQDYREDSPLSERRFKSRSRSRSRSPLRSSRSRSRSRSLSRSRSRSRSNSFEKSAKENPSKENGATQQEADSPKPEKKPDDDLPPYLPALQGCRSVEEFQCLNRIEEGTYGVVYRARDKRTEEIVALKRLKMEKEKEGFPITSLREINTLLKGQHPNIVTVREIVVGSNMDKIFIVMDYVEHDLKSLMETMRHKKQVFVPGEVKCLLIQLLRAVAHLHDNWILHRDLKTSNLLLSHKGILKVGDFGLAREYGSPLKAYTSIVVTLWYRAPELLLGTKEYSTPIDMWSVGCIFAELLTMNALFPGKSEIDQLNRIFKDLGTPNDKIWPNYSKMPAVQKMSFTEYPVSQLRTRFSMLTDLGLNLLQQFLTYDPAQRVTAEKALDHAYFKEVPLPIDPAMFPTWPAKSELGHRKALAASPKPPSGGGQYKKLADGDDDSNLGFHMGIAGTSLLETRRMAAMGGGFSLKF